MVARAADSIILIGMPGAGKSTLGVLLAKALAKQFVDSDLLIQQRVGGTLQAYLDRHGYRALREVEAQVLCGASLDNAVLATGGSAVYSAAAMAHLKQFGPVVYLRLALPSIEQRVNDVDSRGLACPPGMDLADIYRERLPLYERYADLSVDIDGLGVGQALAELCAAVAAYRAAS